MACYLGLDLSSIKIKRFADGEIYVQVQVCCPLPATAHLLPCVQSATDSSAKMRWCPAHRPAAWGRACQAGAMLTVLHWCHAALWTCLRIAATFSQCVTASKCAAQESIRGCDVFLIQPSCPPVNDHLMELLVTIDACKRASARSITAVVPYYGYARADRKTQGRESIAAKLTANLLTEAGASDVCSCAVRLSARHRSSLLTALLIGTARRCWRM